MYNSEVSLIFHRRTLKITCIFVAICTFCTFPLQSLIAQSQPNRFPTNDQTESSVSNTDLENYEPQVIVNQDLNQAAPTLSTLVQQPRGPRKHTENEVVWNYFEKQTPEPWEFATNQKLQYQNETEGYSTKFANQTEIIDPQTLANDGYTSFDYYSDETANGLFWSEPMVFDFITPVLLWQEPKANQRSPGMFVKLTNLNSESFIETNIGHQLGVFRWSPESNSQEGFGFDLFASVFTRFNDRRLLTAADYRLGFPLVYAKNGWQYKLSYEHTSTHLGDEFIEAVGRQQAAHVRDEIVFGIAKWMYVDLRFYGQFGYSFLTSNVVGEDRDRLNAGVEYFRRCPTDKWGQPFAALDLDWRSDQDYTTNVTFQAGWHWMTCLGRSAKIVFEYYNGKSPYGQFYQDDEDWIGFVAGLDY